jgi:hypothetical protein
MNIEQMEQQLEKWKRAACFSLGASCAILLAAFTDVIQGNQKPDPRQYIIWLGVWALIEGLAVFPAVYLTLTRDWRKVPVFIRCNSIFAFLAAAWIAMIPLGLKIKAVMMSEPDGTVFPQFSDVLLFLLVVGSVLAVLFFRFRKENITGPESLFP